MNPAAVIGIIAEYNPFHKGHQYQLSQVRQKFPDAPVIAVSSGSLTQRGEAPIWDKWKRTRLALLGGVDLVLELPVVYSLQSAREFARGAVACLQATGVVTHLSFGCETPNLALLERLAKEQPAKVQWEAALSQGLSYAKAAEQVYGRLNPRYPALLQGSNNLLALEYLRAIGSLAPQLQPLPVLRQGSAYGSTTLEDTLASASALRKALKRDGLTPRAAQQFPEAELPWIRTWLAQGLCGLPEDRLSLLLSYTLECSSPAAIRTACLTSEGHLRGVGHQFLAGTDTSYVRRLMQRCHIAQAFNLGQYFVVNDNGFAEDFAAMYHSVAHSIDFVHGFDNAMVGINQSSQYFFDTVYMIGDLAFQSYFVLTGRRMRQNRAFNTDTFNQTFSNDRFIIHINQLIFDGRAAAVNNKNLHSLAS